MDAFGLLSNITLYGGVTQPWQFTTNDSCSFFLADLSSTASELARSDAVAITESVASSLLWGFISTMILLPWCLAVPVALIIWITKSIPSLLFNSDGTLPKRSVGQDVWTIHGKSYDLSSWASQHPGGETAIHLGRNRDCTGLFESYHIFAERAKLLKILKRFEIKVEEEGGGAADEAPAPSAADSAGRGGSTQTETELQPARTLGEDEKCPKVLANAEVAATKGEQWPPVGENPTGLVFCCEFHEDVKEMLREHFKDGRSHKMKLWTMCFCTCLFLVELVLGYMFLMGSNMALVLLPIVASLLSSNVAHDGSHFAVSDRPWVNRLACSMGMPFFFPPTCWNIQHVVQHHIYTNDDADVDLYHFLPACRASKKTPWSSQFHLQWLLIFWILPTTVGHLLFIVPIELLSGHIDFITGLKRYSQCQNVEDLVARSRGSIWCEFWFCASWLIINLLVQGLQQGLLRMAILYSAASYSFILMTQGAHLHEECMAEKADGSSWAKRQTATAVNFRPESHLWQVLSGGLNVQSLHHVMPGVGSSHYADIYPKFKAICEKHDVELKEAKDIMEFFRGFLRWMQELSRQDC